MGNSENNDNVDDGQPPSSSAATFSLLNQHLLQQLQPPSLVVLSASPSTSTSSINTLTMLTPPGDDNNDDDDDNVDVGDGFGEENDEEKTFVPAVKADLKTSALDDTERQGSKEPSPEENESLRQKSAANVSTVSLAS